MIAFRSGSVPEVVDHGVTGFIVGDEVEAIQATKRVGELDRRKIRTRFETRFTVTRMAREYLEHYETLVSNPQTINQLSEPRASVLAREREFRVPAAE